MSDRFQQLSHDNSLVRAIHTAVKGRARYKIDGLYQNKSLKEYLEFRLPQEKAIAQVKANHLTGNVLVTFHPDVSPNAIALLLQNLVLDYRKETINPSAKVIKKLPVKVIKQKQLDRAGGLIVLGASVVSTLVLSTLLLHRSGLDTAILLTIQKLHSPLLDRIMLGITSLGDPIVLLPLCVGWGMGSLFYRRRSQATTLGIVTLGAIGLNCWLKLLFGRARPALWNRLIDVGLHSFPSGHAMVSIATYGFLGYSLAQRFPQRQREIFGLTAILIGAIGFSRLYLGVHWLTDVTAGYAVGLVWLIACILSSQPSVVRAWQEENTRALGSASVVIAPSPI